MLTEAELAYAAGIIDGEGTIVINRINEKRSINKVYRMDVAVNITEESVCRWLQIRFNGAVHFNKRTDPRWSDTWMWKVHGDAAVSFLQLILPYLIIKRAHAENAIRFRESFIAGQGFRRSEGVPLEQVAIREEYYWNQRKLNQRGPVDATQQKDGVS